MMRSNDQWLEDLRSTGRVREEALVDLRGVILNGLPYALTKWLKPEDPRFDALADEVAQDTILRVMEKIGSFEGRSKFTTWVHTIAVRIALTELRRAKWKDVSLDALLAQEEVDRAPRQVVDQSPGTEDTVEKKSLMDMVSKMIMEELTDKQRNAMIAVAVKGMPLEEVARRTGTNRNAMYKLLHDARLKLKKRLEREGMSPSELLASFADR